MSGIYWSGKIFLVVWFIMFFGILTVVIVSIGRNLKRERDNKKAPVETADVTVLTKRINVRGEHSYTTYYVTFESDNAVRKEFMVDGELYGLLVEGDKGRLTYQGYKVIDFNRF